MIIKAELNKLLQIIDWLQDSTKQKLN